MSGGRDGGGDGHGDGVRAPGWGVPWYRSVGLWLGVPGLVFLVWVWADSFSMGSWVAVPVRATAAGFDSSYEGALIRGKVAVQSIRRVDASPGVAFEVGRPLFRRLQSRNDLYRGTDGVWGWVVLNPGPVGSYAHPMTFVTVKGWFPFGLVVVGYVVVWSGVFALGRWWRRRRWRRMVGER